MQKRKIPKVHTNFTLPPELLKRMSDWMEAQEPRPFRNAVVETAIKQFLDRQEKGAKNG